MPIDHFNLVAGLYDRLGQFTIDEPLAGLLCLDPGAVVLDAGGGTGRVSAALRDRVKKVFVADIARVMLGYAFHKGLAAVCTPVEALPFPSGSIDRIIMMDALHHVDDQQQTAAELWRVLAPGGRIIIVEPDIHKFSVKLLAFGEKILLMRSHFLSGEEISALFTGLEGKVSLRRFDFNVFIGVEKVR